MCEVLVATNLYHTSSSDVPAQETCGDCVAETVVPAVVSEHVAVEFTVAVIAAAQLLLTGT
jgi:hypothetical protein